MGSRTEIYLFSILILQALAIPIFAEENIDDSKSVMLETDKPEYQVGEMIIISGFVEEKRMPVVALRIFDPYGGILSAHQLEIESDNTFSKTILLDSPFYDDEGTYSISAFYGDSEEVVNFEFVKQKKNQTPIEEKKTSDDIKSSKPNEKIT